METGLLRKKREGNTCVTVYVTYLMKQYCILYIILYIYNLYKHYYETDVIVISDDEYCDRVVTGYSRRVQVRD